MKQSEKSWQARGCWSKITLVGLFVVFVVSRIFVLLHPPYGKHFDQKTNEWVISGYSDVKHDSERYANMWHYGLTPYRKHLYEYPPAAVPLVYVPLLVDLAGWGDYYFNYRVGIFLLECLLFGGIFLTVNRLPMRASQRWLSIIFYIGVGVWAKDFWYDGLDLVFMGTFVAGLMWRLWFGTRKLGHHVISWAFFWWSVATKLLTVPLLIPLFFLGRKRYAREVLAAGLGFLIIWGVPLVLFRSSLTVFLFFHAVRPLKYEAFPTTIVRFINDFTHSEINSDIAPHFPVLGPVSTMMERIVAVAFPIAVLTAISWGVWQLWRNAITLKSKALTIHYHLIHLSWVFLWALLLTSKIFSRPFHLWYVPFIVLYPFKSMKLQLLFMVSAWLMVGLDTTPYLTVPAVTLWGPFTLERARDLMRFIPMMIMLAATLRLAKSKPRRKVYVKPQLQP